MATAPVFAPDGSLGDIPVGNLPAALKAGFKPGVTMKSSDGKLGVVPADRVPDAAKSGLQVVPLDQQETQHAGFWSALGSDIWNMVPKSGSELAASSGKGLLRAGTMGLSDLPALVGSIRTRMQEGHGIPYAVGAAENEGLGVNVAGEEQSAKEGDVGGVLGHAAAVPTVMAATAGIAKGADAISEHPAFIRAQQAIKNVTPKQLAGTATGAAAGIGAVAKGHLAYAPEAAAAGTYFGGRAAETLLGRTRANAPMFGKQTPRFTDPGAPFPEPAAAELGRIPVNTPTPVEQSAGMTSGAQSADIAQKASVYRDATRQNVPYAGELDEMSDRLANQLAKQKGATAPTSTDHAQAASVLKDALKDSTDDVVDSAIKPGGENHGANLQTKAEVDFHLQRGDVAGAENALDSGAQAVNPQFDPSKLFAQRQGKVPSTMEIRQKVNAEEPGSPQDIQETRGIQEAMREDLQRHQWSAESEARREFIARNTTGFTKTWGTQVARDAAHKAAMAAENEDMTDLLQKSLEQAQSKKAQ